MRDWQDITAAEKHHEATTFSTAYTPPKQTSQQPFSVLPWGLGGPAQLNLPPKNGDYTIAGIFDLHGQYREPGLFAAFLNMVRDIQPDLTINGGDGRNFDIISQWQKKKLARMTPLDLEREVAAENDDYCANVMAPLRAAVGSGLLIEVEGNHCDRWRKYRTDDLAEGWADACRFFRVDDYLDGYYTRAGVYIRDRFLVRHGDKLGKYPAAAEYAHSHCSGWSGHVHRYNVHAEPPFPLTGERFTHTSAPAACRLDHNYGPGNAGYARSHQGCLVGTFNASNPHDHVTDVGLWNGESLLIRGRRYYG